MSQGRAEIIIKELKEGKEFSNRPEGKTRVAARRLRLRVGLASRAELRLKSDEYSSTSSKKVGHARRLGGSGVRLGSVSGTFE